MAASKFALLNGQSQEFSITHNDSAGAINIDSDKIMSKLLLASTTPTTNNSIEFQLTSNTQLTLKVKGSDGVVRSANITLA